MTVDGIISSTNIAISLYFCGMNLKSLTLTILLATGCLTIGVSQQTFNSKENKLNSRKHIEALHDGVLLVRLPSDYKKIESLTKLLDRELSEKENANVSKELNRTIEENENLHLAMLNAMHKSYTFSDYAFFLDVDSKAVLENGEKIFWSAPDSIKIDYKLKRGTPYYIMTIGQTSDQSVNAFIIKDSNLKDIPLPFPGKILRKNWTTAVVHKSAKKIAKFDAKIWRYFNETGTSE
jgi:hypothetical protein